MHDLPIHQQILIQSPQISDGINVNDGTSYQQPAFPSSHASRQVIANISIAYGNERAALGKPGAVGGIAESSGCRCTPQLTSSVSQHLIVLGDLDAGGVVGEVLLPGVSQ